MPGHWNKDHFIKVKEMGTKFVRIPVHPVAWRERTPAEYIKLLDQAVGWCTELDMYVMLDWHSIGNLETEVFQDPMYDTTQRETFNFWRMMARHLRATTRSRSSNSSMNPPPTAINWVRFPGAIGRRSWRAKSP